MPKTRDMVLRDLRQAHERLLKLDEYFIRSGAIYEHEHPDIYDKFCMLIAATQTLRTMIEQLAKSI